VENSHLGSSKGWLGSSKSAADLGTADPRTRAGRARPRRRRRRI